MFKVEFEDGRPEMYITADGFHTYDSCLTFYNKINRQNHQFGMLEDSTVNVASVRGRWSSVITVNGQPFNPEQSGDTAEDI